eukprot:scaffold41855_cov31-Tisochrysis_lutea.AAC.4
MGWTFHADIHGLNGLHISNLRFRDEMLVYEMHATEFSAVYSGVSNKKDLFYSDGGWPSPSSCRGTLCCESPSVAQSTRDDPVHPFTLPPAFDLLPTKCCATTSTCV